MYTTVLQFLVFWPRNEKIVDLTRLKEDVWIHSSIVISTTRPRVNPASASVTNDNNHLSPL